MPAIDIHTHAFPDDVAARAIPALEAEAHWNAVADGTVGALIESMDAADIDVSCVCPIATKPDQVKGILTWCREIRSDRIDPLLSIHPATPKRAKWIARFAKEGFAGVKLHPMYQGFTVDDESLAGLYEAVGEHGLFVLFHSGYDIAFPGDDRASPERMARVLDRHPNVTFILSHTGAWKDWDEFERVLIGRNVYIETSFTTLHLPPERVAHLIRRHGIDRVLFGTDWPWADQAEERDRIAALGLSKAELSALYWGNAARLLGY